MKHNLKVIFIIVGLFLLAQFIGLYINSYYTASALPYSIERPQFKATFDIFQLLITIIVVALIAFVLIRIRAARLWKYWFLFAVFFCLLIAFSAFVHQILAFVLAIVLAILKVFRPRVLTHNFTELFIYGGLATLFIPLFSIFSISLLLVGISVYDMIAVWKTKHMISMAKFQTKLKIFAGILIPYKKHMAMLGGGDIGFTLLFAGVIMNYIGIKALIVPVVTAVALAMLLIYGKKKKFYPAMPFLSFGCFIGLLIALLI